MTTPPVDPFAVLELRPDAGPAEIEAAYARLQALYSAERYVDGPVEFVAQAATRRAALAAAYAALQPPPPPPPTATVDFRPLPPARQHERPLAAVPPAVPPGPRAIHSRRQPLWSFAALLAVIVTVFILVSLTGVRTANSPQALATPVLQNLALPHSAADIVTLQQAAQRTPSADSWRALGDALFDNLETMRERAPLSAQYLSAARTWSEVVRHYQASLQLRDDPAVRSYLGLALIYGATVPGQAGDVQRGLAESQAAYAAAPANPQVALNRGLALVALNPPQIAAAVTLWQAVVTQAPQSPVAETAQLLLRSYKQ